MDSLLANYASSDEEEHEDQQPPLPKPTLPAKPDKLEHEAGGEEDEDFLSKSSSKRGGIFDSLPPPKSSLFGSLPPPKSQSFHNPKPKAEIDQIEEADDERNAGISKPKSSSSSSLFSSLPAPKSSSSSSSNSKRVVQFRPPTIINAYSGGLEDEDDDDESEEERQRKKSKGSISTSTAASFLASIPAPKHSATLGALPSASGRSRRSVLETATPASSASTVNSTKSDEVVNTNEGYLKDQLSDMNYDFSSWSSGSESHSHYSSHGANVGSAPVNNISTGSDAGMFSNAGHLGYQPHEIYDHFTGLGGEDYAYHGGYGVASAAVSTAGSDAGMNSDVGSYKAVNYSQENGQNVEYSNYDGSYGDYGSDAQYENNWANVSALPEVSGVVENAFPLPGKRGRKDVPPQIVEVKQDELMKNRPREDQVKLTGIAFGPAYQPTSTKGKPSKLHKRKHQIGSLYFDMKQKETELAERRANGYLTKAQTQAKYGW